MRRSIPTAKYKNPDINIAGRSRVSESPATAPHRKSTYPTDKYAHLGREIVGGPLVEGPSKASSSRMAPTRKNSKQRNAKMKSPIFSRWPAAISLLGET